MVSLRPNPPTQFAPHGRTDMEPAPTRPESDAADARARHEALTGGRFLLPNEEAAAASERAAEWNSSLKPYNAFEVFLVDHIAENSIRIEGCRHHARSLRSRHAMRAGLRWEEDRKLDAEELGAKLPKAPGRVGRKLRSTRQGCDWMIRRWEGLGRILDANGTWTEAQTALALDLLGVPAELRDGPPPLGDGVDDRRERVRDEVEQLRLLRGQGLDILDGHDRDAAISGFGPDHNGELAAVRRDERACSRRFEWAREQLKAGRHAYHPDGPNPGRSSPNPGPAPSSASPRPTEDQIRDRLNGTIAKGEERPAAASAPQPAAVAVSPPSVMGNIVQSLYTLKELGVGNRHDRRAQAAAGRRNG